MNKDCISIRGVGKLFGNRKVLNNINLTISKGEIFGLLGPSGAGKTTLIKVITAQLDANEGEIFVQGVDTRNFDKKMYSNFGMVLDNTGLYNRMSCYDNLLIFADLYNINKTRISEILEKVGLNEAKKTPVDKLSKGMRQRLTIARALLHNPSILFLDEPTTGLDPSNAKAIRRLILNERDNGKTIFITTHNMIEATELCNNVALLNRGHIVEYGVPDEICRKHDTKNIINILTKDDEMLSFENNLQNASRIAELFRNGMISSIHSTEPTLETVFMDLTGRTFENE
jgi:hypothetical protein